MAEVSDCLPTMKASSRLLFASSAPEMTAASLTPSQREHVTTTFYDEPQWTLRSVVCREPQWAATRLVVDTPDDLRGVEAFAAANAAPSFAQLAEVEGR